MIHTKHVLQTQRDDHVSKHCLYNVYFHAIVLLTQLQRAGSLVQTLTWPTTMLRTLCLASLVSSAVASQTTSALSAILRRKRYPFSVLRRTMARRARSNVGICNRRLCILRVVHCVYIDYDLLWLL